MENKVRKEQEDYK